MEFTNIPHLDKPVSRIGLGTWAIGGTLWGGSDEKESIETILQAMRRGINFIDTAPVYGAGESEKIIGKALKSYGKREEIILATKCGLNQETDKVFRDSRKQSLQKELEDSLKRLQVDYIDLYQIHWPDASTPIEETAETMRVMLEQGKIRAIGVSNYSVDQMNIFRKIAPLHSSQPPFNLFEREVENTIVTYCLKEHIAIIGYSALCRGLLSGKMTKKREFKGDDLRKSMDPKFKDPQFSEYLACVSALEKWVQEKYHRSLPALAVRWVLDKNIHVALWGARKPQQLQEIQEVLDWKLAPGDFTEIDKIIAEHVKHPVGPQFMAPPERDSASK